ncbi:hypothetical protein PIROE2DRAFT_3461 [Piromyces sp. E2]|nr:hypothetical protein PIROE2DRAFT_3461 [Piromyces sp. E2]|eukprot:OUM68771.1 hypothetical protein PIROE2DRAFT_3461 [Piromyces sp. E2]
MGITKNKKEKKSQLVLDNKVIKENGSGFDLCNLYMDQYPKSHLYEYNLLKCDTVGYFKKILAKIYGINKRSIRIWKVIKRENNTIRPFLPIEDNDNMTIEEMINKNDILKLNIGKIFKIFNLFITRKTNILVFLKYYDPNTRKMEFVGDYIINKKYRKLFTLFSDFNNMKGFPYNTSLLFYKEINYNNIKQLSLNCDSFEAGIGNGDIICFQKKLKHEDNPNAIVYIPDYYDNLRNKLWITVDVKENYNNKCFDFHLDTLKTLNNDIKKKILTSIGTKKNEIEKNKIFFLNENNYNNIINSITNINDNNNNNNNNDNDNDKNDFAL